MLLAKPLLNLLCGLFKFLYLAVEQRVVFLERLELYVDVLGYYRAFNVHTFLVLKCLTFAKVSTCEAIKTTSINVIGIEIGHTTIRL